MDNVREIFLKADTKKEIYDHLQKITEDKEPDESVLEIEQAAIVELKRRKS